MSFFNQVAKMGGIVAGWIYRQHPKARTTIVLLGAILIHLTIGTYHTFGNMLPYMASYMRNYTDPTVRIEHLMWIPTFQGCFPFSMVIGGSIALKLGPRLATFIGCSIVTCSVALSYYAIQHSFAAFFLCYGLLFGLGMGIAYVTTVSTVINWAPDRVGLVSGFVAAGFGISSSIFTPIQTYFVNPHNLPATKEGYFLQHELLERVPNVFLKLAVIYGIMQLVGLLVVCDPPEKIYNSGLGSLFSLFSKRRQGDSRFTAVQYKPLSNEETSVVSTKDSPRRARHRSTSRDHSDSEDSSDTDLLVDAVTSSDTHSMLPTEMLKSTTFYFLFGSLFCCSFYANMFYNLYKTYAETFIEDDFFLAMAFSVGSVVNALARIGWGYMTDRTSFQVTVSTATCIASALLFSMPITPYFGKFVYLIWLCGVFICMGATHALFITASVKCFGSKYKACNYGFLTLSTTCSGVLLSIVSQFYLHSIGYTYLFIFTAVIPFCAFLITSNVQRTTQGNLISNS